MSKRTAPTARAVQTDAPKNVVQMETAPVAQYPEVTETRSLKTYLNDKEKRDSAIESARLVQQISALEEDRKASASDYKARIEGKQARQTLLARLVIDGWEDRSQKCAWHFECAGLDSDGRKIYHPDQKCIVRLDTHEVLEVVAMSEEDFQRRELALGDGDQTEANGPPSAEEETE